MPKTLKRYNDITKEWESVSHSECNAGNYDTDIIVTNINYDNSSGETEVTTLDDTLTVISQDISRLQRNVSWLAEHGGGGYVITGTTSGDVKSDYTVKLIYPYVDSNNYAYVTSVNNFFIKYNVDGASTNDKFTYQILCEGEIIKTGTLNGNNVITVQNLNATINNIITILVYDKKNNPLDPISFKVGERSLYLQSDPIQFVEYNNNSKKINFNIGYKCELANATLNITVFNITSNKRITETAAVKNASVWVNVPIDLSDLTNGSPLPGMKYKMKASAKASLGNTIINSDDITFGVNVRSNGTISVFFDGITTIDDVNLSFENATTVAQNETLSFSYTPYLSDTNCIYYAGKLTTHYYTYQKTLYTYVDEFNIEHKTDSLPDGVTEYNETERTYYTITKPEGVSYEEYNSDAEEKLIIGSYFDENLKINEDSKITDNLKIVSVGSENGNYGQILDESYEVGETYFIVMKFWNSIQTIKAEYTLVFTPIEGNGSIYPFQTTKRKDKSTLIARFYYNNVPKYDLTKWETKAIDYSPLILNDDNFDLTTTINNYKCNHKINGIISDVYGRKHLRIQNKSYSILEFSNDAIDEINSAYLYDSSNNFSGGFTFSITLNVEKHPFNENTVLLWGTNTQDDEFYEGIRIDTDKIYWHLGSDKLETLEVNLIKNKKINITFVLTKGKESSLAKIFIDGIVQKAIEVGKNDYKLPQQIYFGCNFNPLNRSVERFSNFSLYETYICSDALDDMAIVVNAKNSKVVTNLNEDEDARQDYNLWKLKNLFYTIEKYRIKIAEGVSLENFSLRDGYLADYRGNFITILKNEQEEYSNNHLSNLNLETDYFFEAIVDTEPHSYLYGNGTDGEQEKSNDLGYLKADSALNKILNNGENTPLPVMHINCSKGSLFKWDDYFLKSGNLEIRKESGCTMNYYDPSSTNTSVTFNNVSIMIQGTSSLGYRVKNLELFIEETTQVSGAVQQKLFQPKKEWLPEKEFTLKADVVDSSHSNNSVLGNWIGGSYASDYYVKNPAQKAFEDGNQPLDAYYNEKGELVINKIDNKEIRHTETKITNSVMGFPIMLFLTDINGNTHYVGIYSLNLGRYSYYNLGLKFLKNFSRRTKENEYNDYGCPAVIESYTEYTKDESISYNDGGAEKTIFMNEICSYEFEEGANISYIDKNNKYAPGAPWIETSESVIKHLGKFTFMADEEAETYYIKSLQSLFNCTASFINRYNTQYNYVTDENGNASYVETNPLTPTDLYNQKIFDLLEIKDMMIYYCICIAFGMIDSLGKNMTLRTWNAKVTDSHQKDETINTKWYPAFYDLDSSLGLSNEGTETVLSTVMPSKYILVSGDTKASTTFKIELWTDGGYRCYNSLIWDIIIGTYRNTLKSGSGDAGYSIPELKDLWAELRSKEAEWAMKSSNTYIELIEKQMKNCGELQYNADYNMKYLSKFKNDGNTQSVYGQVGFLHGNRIETLRVWLYDRFNFLDSLYDLTNQEAQALGSLSCISGRLTIGQTQGQKFAPVILRAESPLFLKLSVKGKNSYKFPIEKNVDTTVFIQCDTNSQIDWTGISLLSKIERFADINIVNIDSDVRLGNLETFDFSDVNTTQYINNISDRFQTYNEVEDGTSDSKSYIRKLNFKNYQPSSDEAKKLSIDCSLLKRLCDIDISNASVESIVLPDAPLNSLIVSGNTTLRNLELTSQSYLEELDLTGCNLVTFKAVNCESLKELIFNNQNRLESIDFDGCESLTSITISDCVNINKININQCDSLKVVNINNINSICGINITHCKNFEEVVISNVSKKDSKIIITDCNSIKSLTLRNINLNDGNVYLPEEVNNITGMTLDGISGLSHFVYIKEDGTEILPVYYNDDDGGIPVLDLNKFDNISPATITFKDASTIRAIRLPYTETPYAVTNNFLSGCTNIERLSGNISVTTNSVFKNLNKFKLNDNSFYTTDEDKETVLKEGTEKWHLKLKMGVSNITSLFESTNCDINDVYYVLSLCDDVEIISNLFKSCGNVSVNESSSLRRNTFKHCTNVLRMDNIFNGTKIKGYLLGPTFDENNIDNYNEDGLFSPLKNLESLDTPFSENLKLSLFTDDNILTLPSCTSIKNFSAIFIDKNRTNFDEENEDNEIVICGKIINDNDNVHLYDTNNRNWANRLFLKLPKIETLENVFNFGLPDASKENGDRVCHLHFHITYPIYEGGSHVSTLFKNNPNLKNVINTLTNISGDGEIHSLFGTKESNENYFPRKLEVFNSSLVFIRDLINYSDKDEAPYVSLKINNYFLQNIASTIKSISGQSQTLDSFWGCEKEYDTESENMNVPYLILQNCKKLQSCTGLLAGLVPKVHDEKKYISLPTSLQPISIGEGEERCYNIFEGCDKLERIDRFFAGMKYGTNNEFEYILRLKGGQFENYNFSNFESIFSGATIDGCIPYGLFYQSEIKTKKVSGVDKYNNTPYDDIEISYKTPKRNITNIAYALSLSAVDKRVEGTCYLNSYNAFYESTSGKNINDFDIGDCPFGLFEDNEKYNPFSDNGDDRYKYKWNVYFYDHRTTFKDILLGSKLYKGLCNTKEAFENNTYDSDTMGKYTDDYHNLLLPTKLPDIFIQNIENYPLKEVSDGYYIPYDSSIYGFKQAHIIDAKEGYFCPPDVFRYCKDTAKIEGCFATTNGEKEYLFPKSYIGHIPENLFENVRRTTSLANMFKGCTSLFPNEWMHINEDKEVVWGNAYSDELFKGMSGVKDISSMFMGTTLFGGTHICKGTFADFNGVININNLFAEMFLCNKNTIKKGDENFEFEIGLFDSMTSLETANSTFKCSNDNTNWLLTKLQQDMFKYNTNLRYINNFYRNQNKALEYADFRKYSWFTESGVSCKGAYVGTLLTDNGGELFNEN